MFGYIAFVAAAILTTAAGGCSESISDRDIVSLPLSEVRRLSDKEGSKVLLLDSRLPSQFDAGHIPGAMNVPKEGIDADKAKLPSELATPKYVIVYGDNPGDGYAAAITKRLMRAGQKGARLFLGGFAEWKSAGLAIEKSPGQPNDGAAKQ